jgi:hypothetical protein
MQVRKDHLGTTRVVDLPTEPLADGEALLQIEKFALTANNVTYGVVGEKIGYWQFFPAPEGWGVIPVWGFGEVVESRCPEIQARERLYGYFPTGTHLRLRPGSVHAGRLVDRSAHRAQLPKVYNLYTRVRAEPDYDPSLDDARMLLFPLYATSFALHDFLGDNDWFGARQVVVLSASSKTAIGLALALRQDSAAPPAVALTSPRNLPFVEGLGLYAAAHSYDALAAVDAAAPSVVVDFSGDGKILSDLHRHLGENMRFCSNVGITHFQQAGPGPGFIAERSAMFFAPAQIEKRNAEWGPGVFQRKATEFWRSAAFHSRAWLQVEYASGMAGLQEVYGQLVRGDVRPDRGIVVKPAAD